MYDKEKADKDFIKWLDNRLEELGKDDLSVPELCANIGIDYEKVQAQKLEDMSESEFWANEPNKN